MMLYIEFLADGKFPPGRKSFPSQGSRSQYFVYKLIDGQSFRFVNPYPIEYDVTFSEKTG